MIDLLWGESDFLCRLSVFQNKKGNRIGIKMGIWGSIKTGQWKGINVSIQMGILQTIQVTIQKPIQKPTQKTTQKTFQVTFQVTIQWNSQTGNLLIIHSMILSF